MRNSTTANTDGLDWYLHRANHGRGRLTSEAKRLLDSGFISIKWLSRYEWVLTITEAGQAAINGGGK